MGIRRGNLLARAMLPILAYKRELDFRVREYRSLMVKSETRAFVLCDRDDSKASRHLFSSLFIPTSDLSSWKC